MAADNGDYGSLTPTKADHYENQNGEENIRTESITEGQSTWVGAAFNLTSSTVGAGCIGLGGAIANSGGLVSIVSILTFAVLSKYSFDLVVSLGLQGSGGGSSSSSSRSATSGVGQTESSYEGLGYATYGNAGRLTVIISKGLYSYGCNVAYIKIIKDNFSLAASHLIYYGRGEEEEPDNNETSLFQLVIQNQDLTTIILCTTIMFPLCLLRDLSPLERFSALKIVAVMAIVFIVMYLFFVLDNKESTEGSGFVNNWLAIRGGVFESLGTFVFTFVSQHTVHLVFQSLKPSQRNMDYFGKTTILAVTLATLVSLLLGLFVYMTFWENASSDIFQLYPPSVAIDFCRLLLCTSMLLTYPFPLLTVRELLILLVFNKAPSTQPSPGGGAGDEEKLLADDTMPFNGGSSSSMLIPGSKTQLKRPYHIMITVLLWLSTLVLALKASSLGAVLNLTGCALGTVISYILPALFSYKLRGHTVLGTLLLVLGGSVGLIGTYYSILGLF